MIGVGALNLDLFYEVPTLEMGGHSLQPGEEVVGDEKLFSDVSAALSGTEPVHRCGGGSAANTVFALSRLGYSTGLLGVTGKDENGRFLLRSMEGVDISHVKLHKRAGVCLCLIYGGERSLVGLSLSNDLFSFSPDDIDYLNSSKFVHLSSFHGDTALRHQKQMLNLLDEEVYVSFAPGEKYARRGLSQIADIVGRSRILFANRREVGLLTGKGPMEGCKALLKLGAKVIVCTLGREGSLIVTAHTSIRVPAKRSVVVDSTGAGDVYAAGFLAGYMDGATLETCGRIGTAAAALSMSSYGRGAYPDERFLRNFAREIE